MAHETDGDGPRRRSYSDRKARGRGGPRRGGSGHSGRGSGLEDVAPLIALVVAVALAGYAAYYVEAHWQQWRDVAVARAQSVRSDLGHGGGVSRGAASPALASLPTARATSVPGYSRAQFGPAWADVDHNGCDTRDDILRRDLTGVTYRAGSHCVVVSGVLHDPYTGKTITFTKAHATAVQIDHVVALGEAWQSGASRWTATRREVFANDPANLLAVDGPTNEAKGDADVGSWLPPRRAEWCAYAQIVVRVKAKYALTVDPVEKAGLTRALATCPK